MLLHAKRRDAISRCRIRPGRVALVATATPSCAYYEARTGVRTRFLPYASHEAFGRFASEERRPASFRFDLGFSGGYAMFAQRYPMRATLLAPRRNGSTAHAPSVRETLQAMGVRVGVFGWLTSKDYISKLAASKIWFASTEAGNHVGTRFYEVMMSGRAMLICNREPGAYDAIGLREGVHAAMFNTTEEFQSTLLYYLRHDDERQRIVDNARRFMLRRHLWSDRASEFVSLIRDALAVPKYVPA